MCPRRGTRVPSDILAREPAVRKSGAVANVAAAVVGAIPTSVSERATADARRMPSPLGHPPRHSIAPPLTTQVRRTEVPKRGLTESASDLVVERRRGNRCSRCRAKERRRFPVGGCGRGRRRRRRRGDLRDGMPHGVEQRGRSQRSASGRSRRGGRREQIILVRHLARRGERETEELQRRRRGEPTKKTKNKFLFLCADETLVRI